MRILPVLVWSSVACLGAVAFGAIAASRGEPISAAWLVVAAACVLATGYRFYSKFIAAKVLALDDARTTPAVRLADGRDFVPTNRWVVFGHHFAAIAGPGPLVGPILAAQFGYLPGTLWILAGVVLGGAVQDFIILFGSMRRDGRSLGQMAKEEIGELPGLLAMVTILAIMVILLAVLALVVVNALKDSPWGVFTILCTIPIAILMGFWMKVWRPGRTVEATVAGIALLMLSLVGGAWVAESPVLAPLFTHGGTTMSSTATSTRGSHSPRPTIPPTRTTIRSSTEDVHMGVDGGNMKCGACHNVKKDVSGNLLDHGIGGFMYHSTDEGSMKDCTDCQAPSIHVGTSVENIVRTHDRLACQVCHIPTFSRKVATYVDWRWSLAGFTPPAGSTETHPAGCAKTPTGVAADGVTQRTTYSKMKGCFTWRTNVRPTLRYYDGKWNDPRAARRPDPPAHRAAPRGWHRRHALAARDTGLVCWARSADSRWQPSQRTSRCRRASTWHALHSAARWLPVDSTNTASCWPLIAIAVRAVFGIVNAGLHADVRWHVPHSRENGPAPSARRWAR